MLCTPPQKRHTMTPAIQTLAADIAEYVLTFLGTVDEDGDSPYPEDLRYEGAQYGDRLLGAGYSRVVYALGGGLVVKVCLDPKDNKCEEHYGAIAQVTPLARILVPQLWMSPCGRWAIYPRVTPQGDSFGMSPLGPLTGILGTPLTVNEGAERSFCGVSDLHASNVSECQRILDYGHIDALEFTSIARGVARPTPALAGLIRAIWQEQRQAQYLETPDLSDWGLQLVGMGETRVVYRYGAWVYKLARAHKAHANVAEAELFARVEGTRLAALLVPTVLSDTHGRWTVMPYIAGAERTSWPRRQGTLAIAVGIHDTHCSNWTSEEAPRLMDYGNGFDHDQLEEFLAN